MLSAKGLRIEFDPEEMTALNVEANGLYFNLSLEDIIDTFHCLFWWSEIHHSGPQKEYNGVAIHKCPFDMFNYQHIMFTQQPDYVIECGAYQGGSTLFFADTLDLIGKGKVISVDICERDETWYPKVREHKRTILIQGSSTDPAVVNRVKDIMKDSKSTFVILDSLHTKEHVLSEMKIYSDLLFSGNYMIVEDGNLNGHPLPPQWHTQTANEGGPFEAIEEFMKVNTGFHIDKEYENRSLFSYAPSGYIKKLKDSEKGHGNSKVRFFSHNVCFLP